MFADEMVKVLATNPDNLWLPMTEFDCLWWEEKREFDCLGSISNFHKSAVEVTNKKIKKMLKVG